MDNRSGLIGECIIVICLKEKFKMAKNNMCFMGFVVTKVLIYFQISLLDSSM
jgi:hypothetical protein